jgi:hypothetical protein
LAEIVEKIMINIVTKWRLSYSNAVGGLRPKVDYKNGGFIQSNIFEMLYIINASGPTLINISYQNV